MTNIIALNNQEEILRFLNPELLDITETFENGLRSIDVTYDIEEYLDAQEYFKQGHKILIIGDENLTDCLYVIDTEVKQDLFKENKFSFTAEEVLVELNYAPFFTQNKLSNKAFTLSQKNGETAVTVNWNSLNYWFGDYFNIGIVQDCISTYISKITLNGSMSLMSLLRYIEEETGNIFVTRYEKDVLNNTIHRYLDFLNPTNMNKNWSTYFEYDFVGPLGPGIIDDEGNPATEDDDLDDEIPIPNYPAITNINPENLQFRVTKNGEIIESDRGTILCWNARDIGLTSTSESVAIQLRYYGNKIGIKLHKKTYTIYDDNENVGENATPYLESIADDPTYIDDEILLPNGVCFEFYDTNKDDIIYSRTLNPILSNTRTDILDLGYNVDNISFNIDESDTFTAISPVLSLKKDASSSNSLSNDDMNTIVKRWYNLEVKKNQVIPMIVEKVQITGTDAKPCTQRSGTPTAPRRSAQQILGTYNLSSNYYAKPLKPTDQTEETNKTFEYWKATAYWRAPFRKAKGSFHLELDDINGIEYANIRVRPDKRGARDMYSTPKMGQVETSDEDVYAIYNAVAMKLKDKMTPSFGITVDVANYRNGLYNDYDIHDTVYVKLPDSNRLITAQVVKTVKSLHDIADNKIELDNYSLNTKEIPTETYIDADNIKFKYPKSKKLTVQLKNAENEDEKLANKIVTFNLYKVENGASTFTGKVYNKKTDKNGKCSLTCKYNPGDYEMTISFQGDVEYAESSTTILINVSGTKVVSNSNKNKNNSNKNTTATKYKTVKRYWSKYGESPDKKYVRAVGRPSAYGELSKYKYVFWEAEFHNYCPKCHKKGTLFWDIFYAGNEHGDWGHVRKTGNGENGSAEGHIFCSNPRCDGDWSIYGKEHGYTNTRLKTYKKPKKSSKAKAYKLRNGKELYDTQKVKVTSKKVTNKVKRIVKGNPSSKVRKQALAIVGNSIGRSALLKICNWMDSKIHYAGYGNFQRSANYVLQTKHGNCCDGTRLFFELCDAAGLTEYYDLYYVHVYGHVYGQVRNKKTGNRTYIDCASDVHGCYGYVCQGYARGGPSSTYPKCPFQC